MVRRLCVFLAFAAPTAAFAEGRAIGLKIGALGFGAEYTHSLTDRIALRGGLSGSELGFDFEESNIEYEADLVWDSVVAGVDFHPLKTALRLSGRIMKNDNGLDLGVVSQGDAVVTLRGSGTLLGDAQFEADIAADAADVANEIDLDLMPFIAVGFQFRF